jgi:hypothetical protein
VREGRRRGAAGPEARPPGTAWSVRSSTPSGSSKVIRRGSMSTGPTVSTSPGLEDWTAREARLIGGFMVAAAGLLDDALTRRCPACWSYEDVAQGVSPGMAGPCVSCGNRIKRVHPGGCSAPKKCITPNGRCLGTVHIDKPNLLLVHSVSQLRFG